MVKQLQTTTRGKESNLREPSSNSSFNFSVLGEPDFLSASFALRYEVYCKERQFLIPEHYPLKLETDPYDSHAIHVGGTNSKGEMVGTIRLVLHSTMGFPLFEHCKIFPEYAYLADLQIQKTTAEVSRLAITKHHRKPQNVDDCGSEYTPHYDVLITGDRSAAPQATGAKPGRQDKPDIILGIYKTIYQVSKRRGITHWCAAMEKSLVRLMRRFHFAFIPIGPELDYYGPVTPYVVALSEIEKALYLHCPATYADFISGLEPELVPAFA